MLIEFILKGFLPNGVSSCSWSSWVSWWETDRNSKTGKESRNEFGRRNLQKQELERNNCTLLTLSLHFFKEDFEGRRDMICKTSLIVSWNTYNDVGWTERDLSTCFWEWFPCLSPSHFSRWWTYESKSTLYSLCFSFNHLIFFLPPWIMKFLMDRWNAVPS